MQQSLNCDMLYVRAHELAIFHVVVHIFIHFLRGVAVVDETVAHFVEELCGSNFDAVKLSVTQKHVD